MDEFALGALSATLSDGSALTFTPAFDTAVLTYTATAPAGMTTVTVDATAATAVANIASVQYAVGDPLTATFTDSGTLTVVAAEDNIITVRVANEDDTTTRDYTITVTLDTLDDTPPTVDSVTYYSDEAATTEIDAADIGDTVYAVVQFSENIDNVLTVMDTNLGDGIDENIYGQPVLSARIPSSLPGSNFLPLPIIAHDAAFPPNNDRCRATSATNTSRYVCQIPLSLLVPGSVQIRVQAVGLTPSTPDGQTAVTRDLAGNQLAADYLDSDGITANVPAAPTVDSVTHYPTAARTAEISGDVVSGDIYSLIQFTGAAIRLLPAARLQIFYQIAEEARVQFSYQHDAAVGVPAPGACRPFTTSTKENVNDPQFWCRYATQPGDTGQYQIIVGTGTEDIHDQALDPEYTRDTGVNLDVVDDAAAALTMADVSVTEGDGPASITVTLDTAVTSGFTVDVSTADGIAVAPDDYIALTAHTLTFAGTADETQTFSVTIINDAITENEQGEPLTLALGNIVLPPGITTEIAIDTATLTITDNDNDISALTVENVSVGEGEGAAVVSVALDRETYTGFTVLIDTILGTAIGGQDYTTLDEHRLHFIGAAGETQTFSVTITDDNIAEPDETLTVPIVGLLIDPIDGVFTPEFNAATNLNVPAAATITIVDNDKLTFDDTIPDQTWVVGVPVALTLPAATGGNGMPRYTLAGNLPDGITAANNANAATPTTLTGMPTAATASAAALTYTVTDSDPTNPVLPIALTFSATVRAAGDATLTALSVTPLARPRLTLDPPFDAGITTYTAAVPLLNTTTVTVRGTFSDNDATLQCATGATPADDDFTPAAPDGGCPLIIDAGDTVLTARVTAADDITIRDYTITVTLDTLDDTPPTVDSVTYYADKAATTEIAGGADVLIGTTVYAAIQFSESVENTVTREGVNGRPVIYLRHAGYISSRPFEEVPHVIIAPGAAFLPNAAQCRATPATDTNRYLCQVTLLSGVVAVGPVQMGVRAQGLSTPFAVTQDIAGNRLAEDYLAANAPSIRAITQAPPTVTAVTHYPTSATFATSGTISGTVVSGDIYTLIEFTGAAILRNDAAAPAARPEIFYQIGPDAAARVQFEYEFGTGVPAPGTCHLFTTGGATEADDPQFLCRYATSPGDTGQYKIIVGAGTQDIYGQALADDYTGDTGVMLAVVAGTAAALTFSTNVDNVIEVSEGAGTAAITVTLSAAVTSGFTVDVSTADGLAVAPGDYTALTGHTLTFAGTADETQTFSVTIIDDQITENEQGEPLTLTLGNVQGIAATEITIDTATLLIRDNDTSILTINDVSVGEGGGTAEVTVQLEKAFYTGFTVLIDTIDATAISDQDYTSLDDHRLNFTGAAGETHTFSVTITDDAMVEFEETLTVEIDNAFLDPVDGISGDIVRANLNITDTAIITIVDNELSLGGAILDQTWVVGVPVALTLPTATGGNDEPRYTLTGNLPDGVVAANNANAAAPTTLTGTPMAVTDSATLTYTVTDSDQTAPVTSIALTFSAAVRAAGTDATLNALSVMLSDDTDLPLTPAFAAGTFAYTATAPSATTTVTVAAPANDGNATVAIAGTDASGTALGVTGGDVFGLTTGDNIITVTVTAEDRSTTRDYTITLTVPSADATLRALSIEPRGGSPLPLSPAFAAETTAYTAVFPAGTVIMDVTAEATSSAASVQYAVSNTFSSNTAFVINNSSTTRLTVRVIAEDRTTTRDYTVTMTIRSTAFTDADLSALSVTTSDDTAVPLDPTFAAETTTYTATAPSGTTSVTVAATVADLVGASVQYAVGDPPADADFVVSGTLTVATGPNVLTARVTAEDDSTQDYTITLTVPASLSNDATLRALSIEPRGGSPLPLSPAFAAETTAYTAVFPAGTVIMDVTAEATSSAASVQYAVSNTFSSNTAFVINNSSTTRLTVRVIAEDRTTTRDYTVTMTIRSTAFTDATLSGLTVTTSDDTAVPLDPTFAAETTTYTATAPSGTTSVTVAATVNDLVGASVQYAVGDPPADADFVVSGTLTVATGPNVLTARVTAEDDSTQDYTITLTVPSADATLRALSIEPRGGSPLPLSPAFAAETTAYTAVFPAGTVIMDVTAEATSSAASVQYAVSNTFSSNTAFVINNSSTTRLTVRVIAEDRTTTRDYTVTMTIRSTASTDADLSALSVTTSDGTAVTLAPTFDAGTFAYTATAPSGTTSVTVAATVADLVGASVQYAVGDSPADAAFVDSGTLTVATGPNVLTARVTAEDDSTQDYTITLTVGEPTVTSVTSTSRAYNFGKNIIIDVRFSENVTVTGAPELALIGGRTASFRRVVRGTNVRFAYPVAENDNVARLAYTGTYALTLPVGTTIQSADWVDADITLPVPGDPASLSGSSNVAIDTIAPVFTNTAATGAGAVNAPIDLTVYDADATTNGADADTIDAGLTYTLSGPDAGLFNIDEDGLVTYATVQLAEVTHSVVITATDAAGNATDLPVTISVYAAPFVRITDNVPGIATDRVTFTFTWSEPVNGFGLGSIGRTPSGLVSLRTVTPGRVYTLEYTVASSAHNGTIRIRVLANAVTGTLTNAGNAETTATQRYDNVAPAFAAATDAATYLANSPIDTVVYDASATDGGAADAGVTYSLTGGANADRFTIVPATGVVTYITPQTAVATHEFIITATDQGGNTDTVTVTVTIAMPSTDATLNDLSALSVTPFGALTLSPDFVTATTAYATTAQAGATAVLVSATATHAGATVQYAMGANPADTDFTDSGTLTVAAGANVLTARVTAEDRSTRDYTITLTVPAILNPDTTLSALTVTGAAALTLSPAFATETTAYIVTAPAGTTTVTVDATPTDATVASVQYAVGFNPADAWFKDSGIKPVVDGANVITVRVTSGSMIRDYTIRLRVLLRGAVFSDLSDDLVPPGSSNMYVFGGASRSDDFTVDPAHVDVTIESVPGSSTGLFDASVVPKVGGVDGEWTITMRPPPRSAFPNTAVSAYTESFRLIGSEPGRADGEREFSVVVQAGPITLTGLPDVAPTPFTFGGANQTQTFDFTLEPHGSDITLAATVANAANTGLAAAVTGTGASRTLTVTAPDSDNGGPYSDTITVTASADGRTDVRHEMTVILGDGPIVLDIDDSAQTVLEQTLLDFGGPAQDLTFTLTTNAITTFTLSADSANNLVTAAITGPTNRVLSITPVASDPDAGTYIDTVTLTVSSPGLPDVTADVSVMFTQHTDATLSALNISPRFSSPLPLSPAFTAATTAYTVEFPTGTRALEVDAMATSGGAGVQYAVGNNPTPADFDADSSEDSLFISYNGISLIDDRDLLTVRVTAADGTTQDYVITLVLRTGDSPVGLRDLTVTTSGGMAVALSPTFGAETTTYTARAPAGTTAVTVATTRIFLGASVQYAEGTSPADDAFGDSGTFTVSAGDHVLTARVTSEDDMTTRDYTITLNVPVNTDATLRTLSVIPAGGSAVPLSPAFAAATFAYTATAPSGTTTVTIDATAVTGASIEYAVGANPATTSNALTVSAGANVLTVRVTAEDGNTMQDYTITLTVRATASTDADLSNVTVTPAGGTALTLTQSGGTTTGFATTALAYTATAPGGTTTVTVAATTTDPIAASVRYAVGANPADDAFGNRGTLTVSAGANVLTVRVTAEDRSTQDYTITLTVQADPTLSELRVTPSGGSALPLSPAFAAATTAYTATAPDRVATVTVAATATDTTGASIRYAVGANPADDAFGNRGTLTVSAGRNVLTARVTASDGNTRDYTIRLTVPNNTDATLNDVTVTTSGGMAVPLDQTFAASTMTYTATAPSGTTTVTVAATTTAPAGASVRYAVGENPVDDAFGASGILTVSTGDNTLTARVTAEDGSTRDYLITLDVRTTASANANLSGLTVTTSDGTVVTLDQTVAAATTAYTATAPGGTTSVTVAATENDAVGASVQYAFGGSPMDDAFGDSGTFDVPGAFNYTLTVRVTAEDGTTRRDYTITLTVPPNDDATLNELSITPGGFSARTLCHLPCREPITTGFASGTTGYSINDFVPTGTTSIIVAATANDATGARVDYAIGIGEFTGISFSETSRGPFVASGVFAVSPGAYNTFTVRVTAEDSSTQEYTIRAWVPTTTEANNPAQPTQKVSHDWPLIPDNVGPGESFRLLFITSGTFRTSSDQPVSSFISNYNAFVQSAANVATGAGAPIADFSAKFRALVTTPTTDARDNTGTNRVTRTHADAPIYWLNGAKVANNYADFYDSNGWDRSGSEDRHARLRNEHGVTHGGSSGSGGIRVWTGSARDGTQACCGQDAYPVSGRLSMMTGDGRTFDVTAISAYGQPATLLPSFEIRAGQTDDGASRPIYALSPLITVAAPSDDATLRTLSVITGGAALTMTQSGGTTTGFDGTVLAYTATAALGTTMVTMTAVAADTPNAGVQYAVGDPSTAVFTDGGVKTVAGGDNVLTVRVTAEDGSTRRDYIITLTVDVPFVAVPLSLPAFSNRAIPSVGLTRTYTLPEAAGGTPPYTYTLTRTDGTGTPVLPPGMTFNATARTISGAATQPYNGRLRYAVTDANGDNVFTEFTLGVLLGNVPSQTYNVGERVDLTLPGASAALTGPFTYTLTRSGGTPVLPPGLAFDATAHTITGAPTAAFGGDLGAPLDYVITAANGETESYLFLLTVNTAFNLANVPALIYTVGDRVALTLPEPTADSIALASPFTYALTRVSGTPVLPPGLTFDATAHTISGSPTTSFGGGEGGPGVELRYTVTDANGNDDSRKVLLTVIELLRALSVTTGGGTTLTLTQAGGGVGFDDDVLTYTATASAGTTVVTVAAIPKAVGASVQYAEGTSPADDAFGDSGTFTVSAGDHVITVRVTSGGVVATVDATITLNVQANPVTTAPVPVVTLVLTPDSISENGGESSITATLSSASTADTILDITATPDTSTGADTDDYDLPANLSLTIAAGTTTSTSAIMITAKPDDVDAPDKEVTIAATNVQNSSTEGVAPPADVTLTITDDDVAPTVTLVLDPASISENGGESKVTATLSHTSSAATTVTVETMPATAADTTYIDADANDYTLNGTTLTIAAGATASTEMVTITANNDDIDSPPERKQVTVSAMATNTVGITQPTAVTLTIVDAPAVTLVLTPASISESGGSSTVTATLDRASTATTTLTITATAPASPPTGTTAATADDYDLSTNTTLTIAAGTTTSTGTGTVTITANPNAVDAPDKTVTVAATVTNSEGVAPPANVTLTITDDDAVPVVTLALNPSSISENGGESKVTATLSHTSSAATTVTVETMPATAADTTYIDADANDYTLNGTTLTIAAGATASTEMVTITANNDDSDSPPERKQVTVSAMATNTVGITQPTAVTLTIVDAPAVTLVLTPASISENGRSSTVTATLSHASTEETTIDIIATPGTGTDDTDYTLTGNTLTIAAGTTISTGTVTITANPNAVDAPDKTVTVAATVTNSEGVAPPANVTLTIEDDDAAPVVTLALNPSSISENGGESKLTASLDRPSSAATTLTVTTTPDTGATTFYTLSGTDLTIAAGAITSTDAITITANDNAVDAADTTITVSATVTNIHQGITDAPNVVADVTLTLTDDDAAPTAVGRIDQQTVFFPSGTPGDTVTLAVAQYFQASSVLTYTAMSDNTAIATVAVTGAGSSTMLTITSVAAGSAGITVTAADGVNTSVPQQFTVQIVEVFAVGTVSNTNGALDVVGVNNDVRLTLPTGHMVTTITMLTYDPLAAAAADPPNGVTFSGVAVDIELAPPSSIPLPSVATVCLSTAADADTMTGRRAALYHLPDSAAVWNGIGDDTGIHAGFVCGTTAVFSPFAVGYAAVANTARLNEKILTRASQAMTAGTLAAVAARVETAAGFSIGGGTGNRTPKLGFPAGTGGGGSAGNTGGSPTLAYQFGGQSSVRGLLKSHGKAMLQDEMDYARLLDGASFAMPVSAAGDQSAGNAAGLTLWGDSNYRNLNSDEDDLDWDGQIFSAHLGMDGLVDEEVLIGLALSWHRADFDYHDKADGADSSGEYQYRTTNLHPYFGWLPNDSFKVWGTAGYGQGDIEITEAGGDERSTDAAQLSLAGGFSNRILRAPGLLPDSVTTLDLKSDVSLVRVEVGEDKDAQFAAQNIDSRHLRFLVSGEQQVGLAGGGSLASSMEVGARFDSGGGISGVGTEIGAGLHYVNSDGNLTLAGNIRGMQLDDYDEWGADLMFQLLPPGGRGLSFQMQPVWGKTQSAAEQLWNEGASELGGDDEVLQGSLATEVGYGVSASLLGTEGVLTPFVGMSMENSGSNRVRLGGRFSGGNGLKLDLEGVQRNTVDGAGRTVLLRAELAF